ncbi:MAG: hypothetical protein CL925_05300 [Deltaproteobacteria bacterium]|jgi:hypothetical protein|nr:hypothetical protein [Deltaproteobacteria bacterium]
MRRTSCWDLTHLNPTDQNLDWHRRSTALLHGEEAQWIIDQPPQSSNGQEKIQLRRNLRLTPTG